MIARYGRGAVFLLGVLAAVVVWNAARFPPGLGYDAEPHVDYLVGLIERGTLPDETGSYYTPPLFYAVAGVVWKAGSLIGLGEPLRLVQLLNGLFALATAVLLLELGRAVFPGRRRLHGLALGLFVAGALVVKTAAMVHPETLSMLLAVAALVLGARMLQADRPGLRSAVALGALLGAGQLVRAFSLWTFAVVLLAFAGAAVGRPGQRRALVRTGAAAAIVTIVVAAPWYAYQASRYTNPVFDRPQVAEPLWERRPVSFYLDPGLPDVITKPYREQFLNRFWPTLYSEAWGDYFGVFAWNSAQRPEPSAGERRELVAQSVVGLIPTVLMVTGWLALLAGSLRRRVLHEAPERLLVALMPLAGIAGLLYFAISYPTADGDVIKATYMLTAVPAWALCFGLAADRIAMELSYRSRIAATIVLVVLAAVSIRFGLYGGGLGGLL